MKVNFSIFNWALNSRIQTVSSWWAIVGDGTRLYHSSTSITAVVAVGRNTLQSQKGVPICWLIDRARFGEQKSDTCIAHITSIEWVVCTGRSRAPLTVTGKICSNCLRIESQVVAQKLGSRLFYVVLARAALDG